jgi:hypothetical protein
MKTHLPLWQYRAEFFLGWEMFQPKVLEKIKTFTFNNFFFRKSCLLWYNVVKYGRAGQATDDNIIRRMRFACWITMATNRSEYFIPIAFPRQLWLRERASVLRCTYVACVVAPYGCVQVQIGGHAVAVSHRWWGHTHNVKKSARYDIWSEIRTRWPRTPLSPLRLRKRPM